MSRDDGWRRRQASFVEAGDSVDISAHSDMLQVPCVVENVTLDLEDHSYLILMLRLPMNVGSIPVRVRDTELLRWRGKG